MASSRKVRVVVDTLGDDALRRHSACGWLSMASAELDAMHFTSVASCRQELGYVLCMANRSRTDAQRRARELNKIVKVPAYVQPQAQLSPVASDLLTNPGDLLTSP